ncbi:MAG: efflux RND transporter periplasmic adaptor subunit [Gammaproteobacteria bacterium]|nr:efflux RND transporter periplasmic adaptor subunit [Gammaproteobacteria bacterium]
MFKYKIAIWCLCGVLIQVPVLAQVNIPVEVVKSGPVDRMRFFNGVIEAVNQSTISAQTSGQITSVHFDVDDYVKKNDVILRLNDKEQKSRLNKAQSSVKEAQVNLDQAEKEYSRVTDIYKKKLVSKSVLDKAKTAYKGAVARLNVMRAGVIEATEQWQYTVIRAPYSGIVVKRFVQEGESVRPGQPLMTGLSLDHLRATVDIPQDLISYLRQKPAMFVYLPGQVPRNIDSKDMTIFPYADEHSHTFRARLQLPAELGDLYPGMTIKIGMVTGKDQQITVPLNAVVVRSEVSGVYIQRDDGTVSFRQIRPGDKTGGRVLVLSGLREGEKVLLDPFAAMGLLKSQQAQ